MEAKKYIDLGKLVPDDVMVKFILNEIQNCPSNSWLLDGKYHKISLLDLLNYCNFLGFPRTLPQAQKLWEAEKLDVALNLNVPYNVIIERVKGRWVHLPSGRVYNDDFNAPKIPVSIIKFSIHFQNIFLFFLRERMT